MYKTVLSLLVVTAAAAAQSYTISPSINGSSEGNTNNTWPWSYAAGRYQQIHGDLRGNARTITALALRRDGVVSANTTYTARTIDAELLMADSDFALASSTFASNYASTPIPVVIRKMISLPDWTAAPTPPHAWSLSVPFDVPFVHTGVKDLVWEAVLHANTATTSLPADAYQATLTKSAGSLSLGTGCIATGRTARMSLSGSETTSFADQSMSFSWTLLNGPASAATSVLLGLVNPSLSVPGLCTLVNVDQVFLALNATTSTGGLYYTGLLSIPYDPLLVGFQVYAQAASADPGQSAGLPVSLSNGAVTTFAAMPPTPLTGEKVARIYYNGSTSQATGSLQLYFGLLTQFTH